jgi:hypothetical protein
MNASHATRVVPDAGSPGRWVAQYYDAEKRLWFDLGDPRDTEEEARTHLAEEQLDATMRQQLTTDPEAGGPRDPAIGPHPRFREMDARRERFLGLAPEEQAAHVMLRQLLGPKR